MSSPPATVVTPPPDPVQVLLDRDPIIARAVVFVDTMMGCASSDIGPAAFWSRAQSALVAAASQDLMWADVVAEAARKLQVPDGGIGERQAGALAELGAAMPDGSQELAAWCELVTRDAVYVVALCRLVRAGRKAARKATRIDVDDLGGAR